MHLFYRTFDDLLAQIKHTASSKLNINHTLSDLSRKDFFELFETIPASVTNIKMFDNDLPYFPEEVESLKSIDIYKAYSAYIDDALIQLSELCPIEKVLISIFNDETINIKQLLCLCQSIKELKDKNVTIGYMGVLFDTHAPLYQALNMSQSRFFPSFFGSRNMVSPVSYELQKMQEACTQQQAYFPVVFCLFLKEKADELSAAFLLSFNEWWNESEIDFSTQLLLFEQKI